MRLQKRLDHWQDAHDNALVLTQGKAQHVVVVLELVFLQKHHLSAVRHVDPNTLQALRLADQLKDLAIEIDVQMPVLWVTNDESRLQAGLGSLHTLAPRVVPQGFELNQGPRNLVVSLDHLLRLFGGHDILVRLKFAHRLLDPTEQLACPLDVARHGRGVARHRRVVLVLLVELLHRLQIKAVVVKDHHVLAVEVRLQAVALQNGLELLEHAERVLGAHDVLE